MFNDEITPHEKLFHTYSEGGGTGFSSGDIAVLHNIAILLKSKHIDDKYQIRINRFHITVRTMRCASQWDWVKSQHINIILSMCEEIYDNIEKFIRVYKNGQHQFLEGFERWVEVGTIDEGDYLETVKSLKSYYDFITGDNFNDWIKQRGMFYKSLKGNLPKIELIYLPQYSEYDGRLIIVEEA